MRGSCCAHKLILVGQFCWQLTEHMIYAIFISSMLIWYLAYLNNLKSPNDVVVLQCFSVTLISGFYFSSYIFLCYLFLWSDRNNKASLWICNSEICPQEAEQITSVFTSFFFSFPFFLLLTEALFTTTEGWHDRAVKTQQDRYIFNKGSWNANLSLVAEPGKFMRKKLTHYSNSTI